MQNSYFISTGGVYGAEKIVFVWPDKGAQNFQKSVS